MVLAGACGGDDDHGGNDAPPGAVAVLARASKSSTIAMADDGAHVATVNPDDGTLSVFETSDNSRTAKVATGTDPANVVIAQDSKTAYVSNRGDGTVVRVTASMAARPRSMPPRRSAANRSGSRCRRPASSCSWRNMRRAGSR